MARRKSRFNFWAGNRLGHSRAARLGWRRKPRRTRRNGTSLVGVAKSTYSKVKTSTMKGFNTSKVMQGMEVIAGGVATQYVAKALENHVPFYGHFVAGNKWLDILNVFVAAGVTSTAASMIPLKAVKGSAGNVLLGGIISGLNRGLTNLFPGTFKGLGEEMGDFGPGLNGFGDFGPGFNGMGEFVSPQQIAMSIPTRQPFPGHHATHPQMHMGNYVDPRALAAGNLLVGTNGAHSGMLGDYGIDGMGDEATRRQTQHAWHTPYLHLDGLNAVAEMIEGNS